MSQVIALPTAQQLADVWNTIKRQLLEKWRQLTENELEQRKGSVDQLLELIQQKTGQARADIEAFFAESYQTASKMIGKVCERSGEVSARAAGVVQKQCENLSKKLGEVSAETQEFVRTKPAKSVGIAFGVGVLSGVVLSMMMHSR